MQFEDFRKGCQILTPEELLNVTGGAGKAARYALKGTPTGMSAVTESPQYQERKRAEAKMAYDAHVQAHGPVRFTAPTQIRADQVRDRINSGYSQPHAKKGR